MRGGIPTPGHLGLPAGEDAPLEQQQVGEDKLRHQGAVDVADVGEGVITAQAGLEQRLDAGPGGLRPAQVGQLVDHLAEQGWLAKGNFAVRGVLESLGGIGGGEDGQPRQVGSIYQAFIFGIEFGEDEQVGHQISAGVSASRCSQCNRRWARGAIMIPAEARKTTPEKRA